MSDQSSDTEFVVSMTDGTLGFLVAGREDSLKPNVRDQPDAASNHADADSKKEQPDPPPARPDRRRSVRREAHEFKVEMRLAVAGFPMKLVNLSSTGLL